MVAISELKNLKLRTTKIKTERFIYYFSLFSIISLTTIGIYTNTVQATQLLDKNNQAIQPAVAFLKESKQEIVAISHEFVGQVLEAATNDKIFFNVPTESAIIKLSQALINQQKTKFTYICYPHRRCNLPKAKSENLRFTQNKQQYQIKFNYIGKFGKYPIYETEIK